VRQPGDRCREGLGVEPRHVGCDARFELVKEPEHAGPALARVVEADVELGDPLDPEPPAQLVADERHGVGERTDGRLPLRLGSDDAHPDFGVAKVRRRLDVGDRRKPDPRIRHVPG